MQVTLANPLPSGIYGLSVVTPEGVTNEYIFAMMAKVFEPGTGLDSSFRGATDSGDGTGSNIGSVSKVVAKGAREVIGSIPSGTSNLRVNLTAQNDLDIELWDGDTFVVGWKAMISNAYEVSGAYNGTTITWSGWYGTNGNPGNEFIQINGTTQNVFVMKVFGFHAGSVEVNYTWGE